MLCHACYAKPDLMPDCVPCRGTGWATSVPYCEEPWNEVVPGLWMGGHDIRSGVSSRCKVGTEFDAVVSLAQRDGYGPADGVPHVYLRMADAGLDPGLIAKVEDLADQVVEHLRAGRRVLVRCQGGLNRSGLVVALALVRLGHAPHAAIDLVRAARGPYALVNPAFVRHLEQLSDPSGRARPRHEA